MDAKRLLETVRRHRRIQRWAKVAELAMLVASAAAVALVIHNSL